MMLRLGGCLLAVSDLILITRLMALLTILLAAMYPYMVVCNPK